MSAPSLRKSTSGDPLVLFLVLLMQKHLPTGVVYDLLREVAEARARASAAGVQFDLHAGPLAEMAEAFAETLRGAVAQNLAEGRDG